MTRRRSRKSGTHDSFDLFLDTITNTFGGVLLLALLLVLMIRETSEVATESVQTETRTSIQQKIDLLQAEKLNLEQAEQIRRDMAQNLDSGDTEELASLLAELSERNEQLKQQQTEEADNVETLHDKIRDTKSRAAKLELELTDQQESLEKLTKELEASENRFTRTMPTPKEKDTQKYETCVILKNNRVFFVDSARGHGGGSIDSRFFAAANSNHDLEQEDGSGFKARQNSGLSMTQPGLTAEFKKVSRDCYICFVVWPDSFDEFHKVRASCVDANINYRILPLKKGPVYLGAGNSKGKAQ